MNLVTAYWLVTDYWILVVYCCCILLVGYCVFEDATRRLSRAACPRSSQPHHGVWELDRVPDKTGSSCWGHYANGEPCRRPMKLFRGQVKPVFRGPGVGMLIPERNVKPNGPDRHYINLWHCSLQCVRSHPRDSKITGVEHMPGRMSRDLALTVRPDPRGEGKPWGGGLCRSPPRVNDKSPRPPGQPPSTRPEHPPARPHMCGSS